MADSTNFTTLISIHTSPKGGDRIPFRVDNPVNQFQSTPPRREVTPPSVSRLLTRNFNPHLPEGR